MGTRWVISATLAASWSPELRRHRLQRRESAAMSRHARTYVHEQGVAFTLNRARLSAEGSLPNRFNYRFLVRARVRRHACAHARIVSLREAIIGGRASRWESRPGSSKAPFKPRVSDSSAGVRAGRLPRPSSTRSHRSTRSACSPITFLPFFGVAAGVFNGEGQNTGGNRDSTVLYIGACGCASDSPDDGCRARRVLQRGQHPVRRRRAGRAMGPFCCAPRASASARRVAIANDFGWYVLRRLPSVPVAPAARATGGFPAGRASAKRVRISATVGGFNIELPAGRTRFLANYVARKTGYPRVQRNSLIGQSRFDSESARRGQRSGAALTPSQAPRTRTRFRASIRRTARGSPTETNVARLERQSSERGRRGAPGAPWELGIAARGAQRPQCPHRGQQAEQAIAHAVNRNAIEVVGNPRERGHSPTPRGAAPPRAPRAIATDEIVRGEATFGEPRSRHVAAGRVVWSLGQSSRMFVSWSASPDGRRERQARRAAVSGISGGRA
jgi:hypothetical protein